MRRLVVAFLVAGCATTPAPWKDRPGGLTRADIMETILRSKEALSECAERQHAERPGTSGKLLMTWTILTSGKTSNIVVSSAALEGTPIATCVSTVLESMEFPKHELQGTPITFPFKF